MVGLPARGKSYITKKISRYLNWLQHDTRIFNVGERRRVAAGASQSSADPMITSTNRPSDTKSSPHHANQLLKKEPDQDGLIAPPLLLKKGFHKSTSSTDDSLAGFLPPPRVSISEPMENCSRPTSPENNLETSLHEESRLQGNSPAAHAEEAQNFSGMDQSASFFDPDNAKAVHLREEVALATLDELLDYILDQGGSVGIFDATNSTLERRKLIMQRVRERAGPELGVLFLESLCIDENVRF